MGKCGICGAETRLISKGLGVCLECIRKSPAKALDIARGHHKTAREKFGLPSEPPRGAKGARCGICLNECVIPDGGTGYCGIRRNESGTLCGATPKDGKVSWYLDPIPTNCVAEWVCPGCTGAGFPEHSYSRGPEYGYNNLAVYSQGCSFDCLFCQNWEFRHKSMTPDTSAISALASGVDDTVSCVCFFGGDPAVQIPYMISASKLARRGRGRKKKLRICWETNGSMNSSLLEEMMPVTVESGGMIKFDIKAWDENLHLALTGKTNKRTLENFRKAARLMKGNKGHPALMASTLMVPGYIDEKEVSAIAGFIASLNPEIPYSLLAFAPRFMMSDLPGTSEAMAEKCLHAARMAGLKHVNIGNRHLLVAAETGPQNRKASS